jgi:hypothetical protein
MKRAPPNVNGVGIAVVSYFPVVSAKPRRSLRLCGEERDKHLTAEAESLRS